MTKVKSDYILGLDIGTNSCGWAVTDKKNKLLKLRGKTALGSHLFEEGHSAAERRSFRTTRRRLKRRKWRLKLLEEIFAAEMAQVDPSFFVRLHQSWVSPLDHDRQKYQAIVFPTAKEDAAFYQQYPTVYHLRQALMTEERKFDLRAIFIAMHHIVKYRGNFLQDTAVSDFNASKIAVEPFLNTLNDNFGLLADNENVAVCFAVENAAKIEAVIKGQDVDHTIYKLDKVKKIAKLLTTSTSKGDQTVAKQIANAIMGYKTQFETILDKDIDKNDKGAWEFKLSDADADEKLDVLITKLDEAEQTIVAAIRNLFSAITLSELVDEGESLSASMVNKYQKHASDYRLLKTVIEHHDDKQKAKLLDLAYDLYVNNRHGKLLAAKKALKTKNILSKEDFYKQVKANLDDSAASDQIRQEIELDEFMPKQRTNHNGFIPYQLHQIELDRIIANQSKYYPFLAEVNPVEAHRKQAPYKLDELIRFRVPYYVGPLVTQQEQQATSTGNFAWMVRKSAGAITPWNFEDKVEREESANRFIKRMTIKDTYLLGEDVLPANSLLYQKFTVLNELNNVKVNGSRLSVWLKQKAYRDLFEQNLTVSAKRFKNWTSANLGSDCVEGLADPAKFNSSLSSYYHLKSSKAFDQELADPAYQEDFEKIIEWSSIFEDKKIFQEKLREITWLTPTQFKALSTWRLQGWGRLSRKLLTVLKDQNGSSIMDQLWNSQKNFMQIVTEPDFKQEIDQGNQSVVKKNGVEDILAEAYTSPANKKAIRQVVKVVDDVVKAAGGKEPAQFAIEFTRQAAADPQLSRVRGTKLLKAYQETAQELVDQTLTTNLQDAMTSRKLVKDKYFLYFIQGGRDAYTGQKIDFDDITKYYEIDHILPQSLVKDDSFDNRVLVAKPLNAEKSNDVPFKHFANNLVADLKITVKEMWVKWNRLGLISKHKLDNLLLDPDHLKPYQIAGFINRQLVETSQVIKLVAVILQNKYPKAEIITVKASDNSAMRERLKLYKSREVNDYHHAIDAYLSAVCGNFLYQVYPKFRPYFVYGQFKKFSSDPQLQKDAVKEKKAFSFLWPLLQKDNEKRKAQEEIKEDEQGKIVFHKHPDIFESLRRAYNFKYILVSRETTTENSNMFNMTLYPRSDRDTANTRKLIPKGEKLSTAIYGGYSGNADAYMAIIRIEKTKGAVYKVVGVPMRALAKLQQAQKSGNYDAALRKVLEPLVLFDQKGVKKRGIKGFEVVKGRVLSKQVVLDGQRKFMLNSASYMSNAKQLTLSPESMRIVTHHFKLDEDRDALLIQAFDEILTKVDQYLPLFDTNNFRAGLHKGRAKFVELTTAKKEEMLTQILNGLHDNLVLGNLKELGIKTPFGQMQTASGITLTPEAQLLFQSPTGLFQKRVKITDL